MSTDMVWQLVEEARASLGPAEDSEALAERVVHLLSQRDPADIIAFAQPMADLLSQAYRADLWAAAYIINGGASDDGFEYFRGWLVAQGQQVFEQALSNPDSLAGLPVIIQACDEGNDNVECEGMISLAWLAYEEATGLELPQGSFQIQLPELDPDWDFDFDDESELRARLPRLTTLYFGPPA
jgi:hypothetical protein